MKVFVNLCTLIQLIKMVTSKIPGLLQTVLKFLECVIKGSSLKP